MIGWARMTVSRHPVVLMFVLLLQSVRVVGEEVPQLLLGNRYLRIQFDWYF